MTREDFRKQYLAEDTYDKLGTTEAVDFRNAFAPQTTEGGSLLKDVAFGFTGIPTLKDAPAALGLKAKKFSLFLGDMDVNMQETRGKRAARFLSLFGADLEEDVEKYTLAEKTAMTRLALNAAEQEKLLIDKAIGAGVDPTSKAAMFGSGARTLFDYAAAALAGGVVAGPSGAATGMQAVRAAQSVGITTDKYLEYIEAGVDEDKARQLATGLGLANYAIEGFSGMGSKLLVGKAMTKQVAKSATKQGMAKYIAKKGVKAAFGEGVEEAVESIIEQAMDQYVDVRDGWSLGEVIASGIMGMFFGGIAGAGHAGVEYKVARNKIQDILATNPATAEIAQDPEFANDLTDNLMAGTADMFLDEVIRTNDISTEQLTKARNMIAKANNVPTEVEAREGAIERVVSKIQDFDMYMENLAQDVPVEKRAEIKAALSENADQIRTLVRSVNAIERSAAKDDVKAQAAKAELEAKIKELTMAKEIEGYDLEAVKQQLAEDIKIDPKGILGGKASKTVRNMAKVEERIADMNAQIDDAVSQIAELGKPETVEAQTTLNELTDRINSLEESKGYMLNTGEVIGNPKVLASRIRQERLQGIRKMTVAAEKSGRLTAKMIQSMQTAFNQMIDSSSFPASTKNSLRRKYSSRVSFKPAEFYTRYQDLKADIEKLYIDQKRTLNTEALDYVLALGSRRAGLSQEVRDEYSRLAKLKKSPEYDAPESDPLGEQVFIAYHDEYMHPDLVTPLIEDLVTTLEQDLTANKQRQARRQERIDAMVQTTLDELGAIEEVGPAMAFEKEAEPKRSRTAFMSNFKRTLNRIGKGTLERFDPLKPYVTKMEREAQVADLINTRMKTIMNAATDAEAQQALINRTEKESGYWISLIGGENIQISREQAVNLAMLQRMPKIRKDLQKHLMTEQQLDTLINQVEGDVQDSQIMQLYREVLDSYVPRIRDVYNKVYPGKRFSPIDNYFMVSRMFLDGNDFASSIDIEMLDGLFQGRGFGGAEQAFNRNLQQRTGANAIRVGDAFSQMQRYIRNMEHFLAFADYLSVYNQWLGSVQKTVGSKLSKSVVDALHGYAQVISRGDYGIRPLHQSTHLAKFMRNFMTATLAKPKQFVQQYSAVLAGDVALKDVGLLTGEAVQGYVTKNMPKDMQMILDSAYMKQRLGSDRFELFLEPVAREGVDALKDFKKRSLRHKLRTFSRGGDALASLVVATDAFRKAKAENKTDKEALFAGIKAVDTTQQSILPTSNPLTAIGGGIPQRLAYMFKATTTQLANNYLMEIDDIVRDAKKGAKAKDTVGRVSKAVWKYHVVLPSAFYLASYGAAASMQEWIRSMVLGYFGSSYLVGDVANVMYDISTSILETAIDEDITEQKWVFATQDVMGQVLDDLRRKTESLTNAEMEMSMEFLEDVTEVLGPVVDVMTGLPASAGTDAMNNLRKVHGEGMGFRSYLESLYGLSWSAIEKAEENIEELI